MLRKEGIFIFQSLDTFKMFVKCDSYIQLLLL